MPSATGGKGPLAALAAAVIAVLVSGCATTSYKYVSSTSTRTFFKVPHDWTVFHQDRILAAEQSLQPSVHPPEKLPFFVIFDADHAPAIDRNVTTASHPYGLARVRPLSLDEHDSYSLASLRNEVVKVDQLLQSDPNAVDVVSPSKLLVHGGLRGTHLELTVHDPSGSSYSFDQVGFVDSATHTVWLIIVGCTTECYRTNSSAIHRVIASWTVKEK